MGFYTCYHLFMELTSQDKEYLDMALESAREAHSLGNFPVGAVLVIDNEVVGVGGNKINEKKSFMWHAEMTLIMENSSKMYAAYNAGKSIKLYSTLEPCIQCLGASVISYVNEIYYILKDPNGGACDMRHDNIGFHYIDDWPKIFHCPYTSESLDLLEDFLKKEVQGGNATWASMFLELLAKDKSEGSVVSLV